MTIKKRIATLVLCFILLFVTGGESILSALSITASAEEQILSYDNSPIESDIAHMEAAQFPKNENGKCAVIGFMEYCYSENPVSAAEYGLFVYVYNPTEKPIYTVDGYNDFTMRSRYGSIGTQDNFTRCKLKYLDCTENYRFYKFRVIDEQATELYKFAKQYSDKHQNRRYEITELNILFRGSEKEEKFAISKVYEFTGYASWCGDESQGGLSTLSCISSGTQDIPLVLHDTNYRFAEKDDYLRDDLQSVYFSIPSSYVKEWGNLESITADWYEYRTKPVFVTSDPDAYAALYPLRNKYISENGKLTDKNGNIKQNKVQTYWRVLWEERIYVAVGNVFNKDYFYYNCAFNPNVDDYLGDKYSLEDDYDLVTKIDWLFYREDVDSVDDFAVSSEEMKDYVKKYTTQIPLEYGTNLLHNRYHPELFDLDSELSKGYQSNTFYVDDSFDYLDSSKDQSAWSKFWFGEDIDEFSYSPIATISEGDFYLEAYDFSEKYFVEEDDVADIIEYAKTSYENDEIPVLLRFACTDYYSSAARYDLADDEASMSDIDGYVASETVFLNFDILSLSFDKNGKETVIGVVADSIDIINGVVAPTNIPIEQEEWWQKLMAVLMIIAVIVICIFFFPVIKVFFGIIVSGVKFCLNLVIKVIFIPFKLLGSIFKRD